MSTQANTEGMILFTRGNPAPEALPVSELADCAQSLFASQGQVVFQYGHYSGYRPLREWVAAQYEGVGVDEVLVSNSSMEFFTFLAQVYLKPGDTVYVERPAYDRAVTAFTRLGSKVVGINLTDQGPDMDQMAAELKKQPPKLVYLVPDFQNPTGITIQEPQRRQLAEYSREYGFYLVEDAPYRPLRYRGDDVVTLRELAPEKVFHISSFSKILSPGLRVGYLIGPQDQMPILHKWSEDTYIHPSLVTGGIAYEYCRRGLLEPNIAKLKDLYRPRLLAMLEALDQHLDGVRYTKPDGGFFLSLFLPPGVDGAAVRDNCRDFGIVLSDGRLFFPDEGAGDDFIRLPFCGFPLDEIDEGVKRLAQAINHYRS